MSNYGDKYQQTVQSEKNNYFSNHKQEYNKNNLRVYSTEKELLTELSYIQTDQEAMKEYLECPFECVIHSTSCAKGKTREIDEIDLDIVSTYYKITPIKINNKLVFVLKDKKRENILKKHFGFSEVKYCSKSKDAGARKEEGLALLSELLRWQNEALYKKFMKNVNLNSYKNHKSSNHRTNVKPFSDAFANNSAFFKNNRTASITPDKYENYSSDLYTKYTQDIILNFPPNNDTKVLSGADFDKEVDEGRMFKIPQFDLKTIVDFYNDIKHNKFTLLQELPENLKEKMLLTLETFNKVWQEQVLTNAKHVSKINNYYKALQENSKNVDRLGEEVSTIYDSLTLPDNKKKKIRELWFYLSDQINRTPYIVMDDSHWENHYTYCGKQLETACEISNNNKEQQKADYEIEKIVK